MLGERTQFAELVRRTVKANQTAGLPLSYYTYQLQLSFVSNANTEQQLYYQNLGKAKIFDLFSLNSILNYQRVKNL